MNKSKNIYVCQECGYESPKWLGKCPDCNAWNSMVEEIRSTAPTKNFAALGSNNQPTSIVNIKSGEFERYNTNIVELNRVLGGGLVKGSLTLISGAPGIGKSTLLLQVANNIALKAKSRFSSSKSSNFIAISIASSKFKPAVIHCILK